MKPTYINLFGLEFLLEQAQESSFSYIKLDPKERELQLGKLRLIISSR